jgi:mono/diheme cytochrome c family protein
MQRKTIVIATSGVIITTVLLHWLFAVPQVAHVAVPESEDSIERGRYLVDAGGCVSCHEGRDYPQSLSGGLALESEFGTFYVPNITPDIATGVGSWTGQDFLLALKHGRSPGGGFYFPAFPYPSYAGMTDEDALDIAAFLMSLSAVEFTAPEHEVPAWLRRWTIAGWNKLAASPKRQLPKQMDPQIARGAYLARHLGHCGECHTPRDSLGIPDVNREFAGAPLGDGEVEPINAEGLADWTREDFTYFLFLGVKPDGEFVGGEMEQVVEHNTSKLTKEDQRALAAFFKRH